jgi:MoxR-like ATPase
LESLPGLAKTTAVNALAKGIQAEFQRIQFTSDLMPADLTGSDIYAPQTGQFNFISGPIFNEIILADEINRAPPKVQSALLEAMQEHQVTVGGKTRTLPELFIVMATQNPLEQSGTYPLPEAQLDRFLLHVVLDYPSADEELLILQRNRQQEIKTAQKRDVSSQSCTDQPHIDKMHHTEPPALKMQQVFEAQQAVLAVHLAPELERYIIQLVGMTRQLEQIKPAWKDYLQAGASPRASLALAKASSALAYLRGRDYVVPDDIIDIAPDILRHRLVLAYAARAVNISADDIIQTLLAEVTVP